MTRPVRQSGFTLLELLVAVAVFGIVMAIAYQGLNRAANNNAEFEQRVERLGRIQLAAALLERDLSQALPRTVRDGYGDRRAALIGEPTSLELTRMGVAAGPFPERPQIERVTWQLDGDVLIRHQWLVLDRAPGSVPASQEILTGVERLEIEYFTRQTQWRDDWPPPQVVPDLMPKALRVTLEVEGFGRLQRLVELPTGVRVSQAQGTQP